MIALIEWDQAGNYPPAMRLISQSNDLSKVREDIYFDLLESAHDDYINSILEWFDHGDQKVFTIHNGETFFDDWIWVGEGR